MKDCTIPLIFTQINGVVECGKAVLEQRRRSCQNHNRHLQLSLSVRPYTSPKAAENRKLKLPEIWAFLTVPCIPGVSRQQSMVVRLFLEKVIRPHSRRKIIDSNENWSEFNRSAISKKSARHLFAHTAIRYQFIADHQQEYPITVMCEVLEVSVSGFYAWRKREPSQHSREDAKPAQQVKAAFQAAIDMLA
jgi:hypothetical protein